MRSFEIDNESFRIAGFDTSLASFGLVLARVVRDGFALRLEFIAGDVVKTEPNPHCERTSDDLLERFAKIARHVREFLRAADPHLITVEQAITPVGKGRGGGGKAKESPQVAQNLGRARGIVDAFAAIYAAPVLEINATRVKKAVTGSHLAEKAEVIRWLERHHPEIAQCYPINESGKVLTGRREHVADAAGTVLAALERPEFINALANHFRIDPELARLDDWEGREALCTAKEGSP